MVKFRLILFCVLFYSLQGCASPFESEVSRIFEQINNNIEKSLERRFYQNNLKISLLNDELKNLELSDERKDEIKDEINRLETEKHFLFVIKPQELFLKYEILDKYEITENVSEMKVKITGKTLLSSPSEESKLVDIPEDASYLLFRFDKSKSKDRVSGPFQHSP